MTDIIIPVIIALFVSVILSIIFKGKAKVDKGFKLNYFKLSYRRKMIRTLTSLPFVIVGLIVIYYYTDWSMALNILFGLLFLLAFSVQLIYNFKMWKKME
ncbi:ATPase [Oceanobacillus halotolerans]|uniref:ATPase n=1 Tax=Oceanobacillus halotolerans TaxID=2663380 RepID=UPI0013D98EF8|nr:ATPase [Oceanobacillus halotolerans]